MFGVGTQELLIILFAALLLFGGKRLPEIARSLGAGLRDFRRAVRDVQREIDLEILREQSQAPNRRPTGSPAGPEDRVGHGETKNQPARPKDPS